MFESEKSAVQSLSICGEENVVEFLLAAFSHGNFPPLRKLGEIEQLTDILKPYGQAAKALSGDGGAEAALPWCVGVGGRERGRGLASTNPSIRHRTISTAHHHRFCCRTPSHLRYAYAGAGLALALISKLITDIASEALKDIELEAAAKGSEDTF